jgi:hypothetical protein
MNFADGGIVAFADGGVTDDVVANILQKSPYARTPEDNALLAQAGYALQSRNVPQGSGVAQLNEYLQNIGPRLRNYFTAGASKLSDEELQSRPNAGGVMNERLLRQLGISPAVPTASTPAAPPRVDNRAALNATDAGLRTAPAAPPTAAAPQEQAAPAPRATPNAVSPGISALAPSTRAAAAGPTPTARGAAASTALDPNAMFKKAEADLNAETSPDKAMLEELGKERTAAAQAELESTRKRTEKYADAYKGKRERIDKQEAELGGMKNQTLGLALLQAGAAMMSTPGGLGAALGRGVETGTRQYAAGLEKLSAAKEKIADARDRLEELERNRSEMSDKEIAAAEKNVRESGLSARENMIKYVMENRKVNRETAAKIVAQQMELGIAQLREQGAMDRLMVQERGANARAAASRSGEQSPERQVFQALVKKHGGDAVAAYNEMTSSKRPADPMKMLELWTDVRKSNDPMSAQQFLAEAAQLMPTTKLPPNAVVRTLPPR